MRLQKLKNKKNSLLLHSVQAQDEDVRPYFSMPDNPYPELSITSVQHWLKPAQVGDRFPLCSIPLRPTRSLVLSLMELCDENRWIDAPRGQRYLPPVSSFLFSSSFFTVSQRTRSKKKRKHSGDTMKKVKNREQAQDWARSIAQPCTGAIDWKAVSSWGGRTETPINMRLKNGVLFASTPCRHGYPISFRDR